MTTDERLRARRERGRIEDVLDAAQWPRIPSVSRWIDVLVDLEEREA